MWRPLVLSVAAATVLGAQKPEPTIMQMTAITERGRELALYDSAAWHGSDAVMRIANPPSGFNIYMARRVRTGWEVLFGTLTANRDTFAVQYIARGDAAAPDKFRAEPVRGAIRDFGLLAAEARALEVATQDFKPAEPRPYNRAALPAGDGTWWVYLMPAQTDARVFPLGADARYRVSADGRTILERRQLHNALMNRGGSQPRSPDDKLVAGMHTAVLDDYPEDTDVFNAVVRTPKVPEYIVSDHYRYRIDPNGYIAYLGPRKE